MAYPGSINALTTLFQDSDGVRPAELYTIANPYTYRLGANASPAYPAAVQLVPHGAPALPSPAAPTLNAHLSSSGHFLVTSSAYKWAVAVKTRWGLTAIGSLLTVTPTGTGVLLNVAAAPVSTQNPPSSLILCRTKAAGSTLYIVRDLGTTAAVTVADGTPDDDLTILAPVADSSGFPMGPSTSAPVQVSLSGVNWTERALGTTLTGHDYSVDYGYGTTGGTLTFAAADAGTTVTITYTASPLDTAGLLDLLIAALKDIPAATQITPSAAVAIVNSGYSSNFLWLSQGGGHGTDARGAFSVVGAFGGAFASFTFASAYGAAPLVGAFALDDVTAVAIPYVSAHNASGFTISIHAPVNGTTYSIGYIVIG